MIKYFYELTEVEFDELVKQKLTWAQCAELYPQPTWCNYPEAICGVMGCWTLMSFLVTDEGYCKKCDCYKKMITKPNVPNP